MLQPPVFLVCLISSRSRSGFFVICQEDRADVVFFQHIFAEEKCPDEKQDPGGLHNGADSVASSPLGVMARR